MTLIFRVADGFLVASLILCTPPLLDEVPVTGSAEGLPEVGLPEIICLADKAPPA